MHQTPRGFRDILPAEALERERIEEIVKSTFSKAGYLPVETPLLEMREVLERAGHVTGLPFQLFDSDERLLMLRSDNTLPIDRMASTRFSQVDLPLRLRYNAPVVRERNSYSGLDRQSTQLGVELIGEADVVGEVEVVTLLAQMLRDLDVADFTIVLGSVRPFEALLEKSVRDEKVARKMLSYVHASDLVSFDALVEASDADDVCKRALCMLPRLRGVRECLAELEALMDAAGVGESESGVSELVDLFEALPAEVAAAVSFDFSIIKSFDYYTGVVFKAYSPCLSSSLASGGRYDAVLDNLGMSKVAACGFALTEERLQEVLSENGRVDPDRPLRIAVPKGSLFKPTIDLLERAGLDVSELREPGRRLIIPADGVEYVIVRATDAPVFVASGGADCGVCGYDSLYEANIDLVQLVDLKFGACHFVVAEPRANKGMAEASFAKRGAMRVVTKYPRITRDYYNRIGQPVDILQLHGNIELGPIVGMADRIVDITATGTTLRENDLVVVDDDVLACTARFFASPAAYRSNTALRTLADRLADLV
jgi:ATP phosphoribosyltransferase regulatory subunit